MKIIYPTSYDDARNNGQERGVSNPRLPLGAHGVSENGGEERRGGSDGLVKRHRNVPERHVPADDGEAENDTERHDPPELAPGPHALQRNCVRNGNNNVAEERAHQHVTRGEEHGEPKAVVA